MMELTISNLELEFLDLLSLDLAEYLLEVRVLSNQLGRISRGNLQRYENAWAAYREMLNVRESPGVIRLTVLATIFLLLSLSASILAMNIRFRDLYLLLFDIVGVFLILGSLALIVYSALVAGYRITEVHFRHKGLGAIKNQVLLWFGGFISTPGLRGKIPPAVV